MTVKELIEHLQQLDPELNVFTRGYEGGVDDLLSIDGPTDIILDVNSKDKWWYGRHEYSNQYYKTKYSNNKTTKGIVL
jgi:hypothetical protein